MKNTVEELKEAYEEMIEVMNLTETKKGKKVPVTVPEDADEAYLVEKLNEAIGWIEKDDKFTDETQAVIDNLQNPEEDAPEEEVATKPTRGAKKPAPAAKEKVAEKKPKGKKPEKAGEPGKPGIIATIAQLIKDSGKAGISKEDILKELVEQFPDREETSMKNTVNVQIPARIQKERFLLKKLENGNWTYLGELKK